MFSGLSAKSKQTKLRILRQRAQRAAEQAAAVASNVAIPSVASVLQYADTLAIPHSRVEPVVVMVPVVQPQQVSHHLRDVAPGWWAHMDAKKKAYDNHIRFALEDPFLFDRPRTHLKRNVRRVQKARGKARGYKANIKKRRDAKTARFQRAYDMLYGSTAIKEEPMEVAVSSGLVLPDPSGFQDEFPLHERDDRFVTPQRIKMERYI